jgi:hypothetical protein
LRCHPRCNLLLFQHSSQRQNHLVQSTFNQFKKINQSCYLLSLSLVVQLDYFDNTNPLTIKN